jgi:hypothetical protein
MPEGQRGRRLLKREYVRGATPGIDLGDEAANGQPQGLFLRSMIFLWAQAVSSVQLAPMEHMPNILTHGEHARAVTGMKKGGQGCDIGGNG